MVAVLCSGHLESSGRGRSSWRNSQSGGVLVMRLASVCLVLMCAASTGFAQVPTAPAAERAAPASGPITIDVEVTDKAGNPVPGLQQQDFTLLDKGQPAPILTFRAHSSAAATPQPAPDAPVMVLLIDDVNAGFQSVSNERIQIDEYLHRNGGHLPVAVTLAFLSERGFSQVSQPSTDGNLLASVLDKHQAELRDIGRSAGFYGGAERLELSLRALQALGRYEESVPGRKLVVWVSPGWWTFDNPNVIVSSQQQRSFFDLIVNLSDSLRRGRVVLYAVDPSGMGDAGSFRTFLWKNYLKPVPGPSRADPGDLALQVISTQSGGKVLFGSNDIAGEIGQCAEDASAWYTLSFDPAHSEKPDTWHDLAVKIDKPGVIIRTRNGYYAQP